MTVVLAQELRSGDRFDATQVIEEEIERSIATDDIPLGITADEWAEMLRRVAENEYFTVDLIEDNDPAGEWVLVYANPHNLMHIAETGEYKVDDGEDVSCTDMSALFYLFRFHWMATS